VHEGISSETGPANDPIEGPRILPGIDNGITGNAPPGARRSAVCRGVLSSSLRQSQNPSIGALEPNLQPRSREETDMGKLTKIDPNFACLERNHPDSGLEHLPSPPASLRAAAGMGRGSCLRACIALALVAAAAAAVDEIGDEPVRGRGGQHQVQNAAPALWARSKLSPP